MRRHNPRVELPWSEWPPLMLYVRILARNQISPASAWWWVKFLQGDLPKAS